MKTKLKFFLGAALCLLAILTTAHATPNGKGGGGSGGGSSPGGTIYYTGNFPGWGSGTPTISMNPDGSNKTVLGTGSYSRIFGNPSWQLHNDHRWFLAYERFTDEYYPDGSLRMELFALRDDHNHEPEFNDNPETRSQLTDDLTLQLGGPQWVPGDQWISIIGRRWSSAATDATVVEGGIYVVPLVFDAAGNVIGLGELPTTPTIPLPLVQAPSPQPGVEAHPQADVTYFSWNPTGTMFVYTKRSDSGVWVADLFGGEIQISSDAGLMPEWSPDGETIVYSFGRGLITIKPDGKKRSWIVWPTSEWLFRNAFWSPDSGYLVFSGWPKVEEGVYSAWADIFRVNANGRDLINLTNSPDDRDLTSAWNAGWR